MKEKRKTRLNKTSGTKAEFLGFGAFVDDGATDHTSSSPSPAKQSTNLRWSPVYTGKDSHLASHVFPRLIKRDATTKVKALQELQDYFAKDDPSVPRKQQVDALAHYVFLFYSKLTYDASSSVRAEALLAMTKAAERLPKAFQTLAQQQPQTLGMMFCAHADPAAEVRAAAVQQESLLPTAAGPNNKYGSTSSDENNDKQLLQRQDWESGVWYYVERILSYGRASVMHEDLLATGLKSGSSGSNKNEDLNDTQKDQLEELFERIVGTALGGIQLWIQQQQLSDVLDSRPTAFLWKNMASPKASLRRKTYQLLAICCGKAPAIIFESTNNNFPQTLPQALAAEKDPGNLPSLLEALLAYLAALTKTSSSPWESLNASTVTKNLVKLLKKSCHGASAQEWGPSLLPILAMLPSRQDQIAVLSATWKGRDQAVRLGDQSVVVATVSESAAFLLLRKNQPEAEETETNTEAQEVAQLWLDCLQYFLMTIKATTKAAGPVHQAHGALTKGLAQELMKIDAACHDRSNCAMYTVREWFWTELEKIVLGTEADAYTALGNLIQQVLIGNPQTESTIQASHLTPIFRQKFSKAISTFQVASGAIPSIEAYDLFIALLQYCGMDELFDDDDTNSGKLSLKKFLMNDVLRWLIIHTSMLSTHKQTKALVQKSFIFYGGCWLGLPSEDHRHQFWETTLREVTAAKCNLHHLVSGVCALLQHEHVTVELIQCDSFDKLASSVVQDAINEAKSKSLSPEEDEADKAEDDEVTKSFLHTCAGLAAGVPCLIGRPVLSSWVDYACPSHKTIHPDIEQDTPGPIMETLVELVSLPTSVLQTKEIQRVMLHSWRQGGQVWDEMAIKVLSKDSSLCSAVVNQASEVLQQTLSSRTSCGNSNLHYLCNLWAKNAWRLLQLCKQSSLPELPGQSFALVGLANMPLWESLEHRNVLFCGMMHLFHHITDVGNRLQILNSSVDENGSELAVTILTALSEASADVVKADRSARRSDMCAQVLAALGGKSLDGQLIERWFDGTVVSIQKAAESADTDRIRRGVGVVSQLLDLFVERPTSRDVFSATEVEEEELGDEFKRERIARKLVQSVKSSFTTIPWESSMAELVNVVISQCGLDSARGIGSVHYDLFQLIVGTNNRLRQIMESDNASEDLIVKDLWNLSFACGFGLNTPSSLWHSDLASFDPSKTTSLVLQLVGKDNRNLGAEIRRAVLAWLVTSTIALEDEELRNKSIACAFGIALGMLASEADRGSFCDDTNLAMRAMHMAQVVSRKKTVDTGDLKSQVYARLMQAFSLEWENQSTAEDSGAFDFDETLMPQSSSQPEWRRLSLFHEIIKSGLAHEKDALVAAASELSDELVDALYVRSKRWYALQLLDATASMTKPIGDGTLSQATAQRLKLWKKDLEEEEKEELEGDVEIAGEWIPRRLMTEIESWVEEEVLETASEDLIIGRLLLWLSCLRFVDASIEKDSANRPSLLAYLDKCGVVESILNLTLLHTGIGAGRHSLSGIDISDVDQVLRDEAVINPSNLAAVSLFRTIEALPSLSRRWWEEECPKVYNVPIRECLEAQVTPAMLQRELERIKYATNNNSFGAMQVKGSAMSREITASYTQDDFQLKVLIRLPPCFPFRSAEVDCSQTLGVPQKRWKLWSLQITHMLNNEGGSLHDALLLWKENVDKEFEGVEPCPVCYSVLHVKSHKLPEMECKTCQNRFHLNCLTEWFRSSGKTQCVLCQQPWSGSRVRK